jgi:hypothetical protein
MSAPRHYRCSGGPSPKWRAWFRDLSLLPARAWTPVLFSPGPNPALLESHNRILDAASVLGPRCETGLCHFRDDHYFPLFARLQRLGRANEPKSPDMRTASESLGGISVAKSRTAGLKLAPQRRQGRRLILPGWAQGFELSDDLCWTMQIAMLINCLARKAHSVRLQLGWDHTR